MPDGAEPARRSGAGPSSPSGRASRARRATVCLAPSALAALQSVFPEVVAFNERYDRLLATLG